jgi:hypothetical protein
MGQLLRRTLGVRWVMARDASGRDPALRYPRTRVLLFPMPLFARRAEAIANGDPVSPREVYDTVCAIARKQIALPAMQGEFDVHEGPLG